MRVCRNTLNDLFQICEKGKVLESQLLKEEKVNGAVIQILDVPPGD